MQSGDIGSRQSAPKVSPASKTRMPFFRLIVSVFLLIGAGPLSSSAAAESPKTIELSDNWKLTSANACFRNLKSLLG